ncbi:MAG: hypothetical protein AAGH49_09545 [Pseudomonadota bacterium]
MKSHMQLERLSKIADLLAQRALSDLAAAERATRSMQLELHEIDERRAESLANATTPHVASLALKFNQFQLLRRREVLAQLSQLEAKRRQVLALAQRAEGRRQVLSKLIDQAS